MKVSVYWPFLREEELPLLVALAAQGDDVVVQTVARVGAPNDGHGEVEIVGDLPDVSAARTGMPRWLLDRARVYITRARRRHVFTRARRPDVVHVIYQNLFTDVVALDRLRRRVPLVSTVHDVWPHNRRLPDVVYRPLLRRLYRTCGEIVVLHDTARQHLVDDFGVDPERVHLVPHQVPRFRHEPRHRSDRPTVLFFGTLRRNKGLDTLLAAATALDAAGIRLVVAGRGDPGLEAAVRDAASRVPRMHAEIARITAARKWELFDQADLVVLPYSSFASESGVLNDAYGHHLPVVVTDVASLGVSVRAHGTGWVVPIGDHAALATTIVDALEDRVAWSACAAASRARAEANTPTVVATRLHEVYDVAVARWRASR